MDFISSVVKTCHIISSNWINATDDVTDVIYQVKGQTSLLSLIKSFADIDNNGQLDQKDFECMAVRACVIEGKGECNPVKLGEYQHIMRSLWDEISDLADFDKVTCFFSLSFFDKL